MVNPTPITHHLSGRNVRPLILSREDCVSPRALLAGLNKIGFGLDERDVHKMVEGLGLDAIQGLGTTTASIMTPVQFLQEWLPDLIRVVTAPRQIDTLVGVATAGSWETEEVVQGILERTGTAQTYIDRGNVNLTSANFNMERRTVVRGESGLEVGMLEEARASAVKIALANEKRTAATEALEIFRNSVGFYGYNNGSNRTYGFLNDPNLPAYVTVASNGTTTNWSGKTFQQIQADFRSILEALRVQSKGLINPEKDAITIALPVASVRYLSVTTDQGVSIRGWLKDNYLSLRIEQAPELDGANGGANAGYAYAESFGASGNGSTFMQIVPARTKTLGVEKRLKSYIEAMTNATAGIFCRYPVAVYRFTGF
jgi:hypothetical protein